MRGFPVSLVLFVCMYCGSPAGFAVQGEFLRGMPAESMTQEDIQLLMGAVNAALEASPDQTTTQWNNPKTQAHGDITPVGSFEKSGRRCRKLEVANTARGRSNRVVVSFCRQADGQWKVEPD